MRPAATTIRVSRAGVVIQIVSPCSFVVRLFADHTHDVASVTVPSQPSAVAWSLVESALRRMTVDRSMREPRSAGQTVSVLASERWR